MVSASASKKPIIYKSMKGIWLTHKQSQLLHPLLSECIWGASVLSVRNPNTDAVDESHLPQELLPSRDIYGTFSEGSN